MYGNRRWFKQLLWSVQCSFGIGLGLSQILMLGAIAAELPTLSPQVGTYLYGQTKTANQLGREYIIFAQSGQQVVGALYVPQSEYSCFTGQRTSAGLVVNVFEPTAHPELRSQPEFQVPLPTLHAIPKIGPAERQMLATCQQEAVRFRPKIAQPIQESLPAKMMRSPTQISSNG